MRVRSPLRLSGRIELGTLPTDHNVIVPPVHHVALDDIDSDLGYDPVELMQFVRPK